jgi:hypothetical protein
MNDRHPSQTRHLLSWDNGSGKVSATFHGESEVDHAWRTIPRDLPGGTPTPHTPPLARAVAYARSLATPANIVTVTVTAAMIALFVGIILAWFLDWKMP